MPVSSILNSLGEWDQAQAELTDPTADGPRPAINRAICDAFATQPGQLAATALGPGSFALGPFCKPYYDDNGDTGPTATPEFTGGQCVGRGYTVTVFSVTFGQSQAAGGSTFQGPIGPVTRTDLGDGRTAVEFLYGTQNPRQKQNIYTGSNQPELAGIVSVSPVDGLPDDCGDPPVEVQPDPTYSNPRPIGSPTPITVGGDTINITISPSITDIDGNNYLTVEGPSFEVNVPIDGPGEIVPPRKPEPPVVEGDPVDPVAPGGEVADDITEEEEEQGFETIGYRWDFLNIPPEKGGVAGTSPMQYYDRFASIQLKLEGEGGVVLWSQRELISVASGSIIRSDPSLKVIGVAYNSKPSYNQIRLTPLRARSRNGRI